MQRVLMVTKSIFSALCPSKFRENTADMDGMNYE